MLVRNASLTALLMLGATAAPAAPEISPRGPFDYEMVEVAEGVYTFIETKVNSVVSGNVVAVIGRDAILVFDAGHHPPITRSIIADIRKRSSLPVRYLVVSHWHEDHWAAAAEFADAWPGLEVIAHPFTAALMETHKDSFRGTPCRTILVQQSQPLRDRLASGKRPDGSPLPDDVRARTAAFLEGFDAMIAECDSLRYRPVDRTFDGTLDIELGGRRVSLRHLGRGNTAGDVVAYLPDSNTLLTGDLVVSPFPFATQPYVSEWARVLRQLEAIAPATIVPGHGQVMRDPSYLRDVAGVLESIASQARAAYREGMTADELRARIDLADFRAKFARGDAFVQANFDYMLQRSAVNRMWQELAGKLEPEGD